MNGRWSRLDALVQPSGDKAGIQQVQWLGAELELEDKSLPPIEFGIDPCVPGPHLVRFSNELFTHLQ